MRPGVVILSDSYYPGWQATVDGEPARIYAANHLFRGVEVGAGVHEVRFIYRPSSIRIGAGLSFVGVIVLVALFIAARHEGRKKFDLIGTSQRQIGYGAGRG